MTQGLWNSRIFVIASEAKKSLEILDFYPRNSKFSVILGLDPRISSLLRDSPKGLGMTKKVRSGDDTSLRNSRIFVIASEAKQSL